MISTADISRMRTVLDDSLPGTATIKSRSFTDNGGGGGTLAYTNAGTVACRIAPMSASERETANRISADANWIVTLPAETDVALTDRLSIDTRTFEVLAIRGDRSYEVSTRVECNEVV